MSYYLVKMALLCFAGSVFAAAWVDEVRVNEWVVNGHTHTHTHLTPLFPELPG